MSTTPPIDVTAAVQQAAIQRPLMEHNLGTNVSTRAVHQGIGTIREVARAVLQAYAENTHWFNPLNPNHRAQATNAQHTLEEQIRRAAQEARF
jgi:hypothetical protein